MQHIILLCDIEVQMQYPSITVGKVNSVAKLCAVISVGAVGENVTVVLQTHSITGMFKFVK